MDKIPCHDPAFQNVEHWAGVFERETGITLPHCDYIEWKGNEVHFVEETEIYPLIFKQSSKRFDAFIAENVKKMWGSFCLYVALCVNGGTIRSRRRIFVIRTTIPGEQKAVALLAERLEKALRAHKDGAFHEVRLAFAKEVEG